MIKKVSRLVAIAFMTFAIVISISSCALTSVENNIPSITKYDDALLWEINGTDCNGSPSKLYVLGTIHLGDERLYPLPESVVAAYNNADRLVAEMSTDDFNRVTPEIMGRQIESMKREIARVSAGGAPLESCFSEDELDFLLKILGSEEVFTGMLSFEPWCLMIVLTALPMQYSGLDATKGIDNYIIQKSLKNGKTIEGLDTLDTQLDILAYGDWDTQLIMVKELLKELMDDPMAAGNEFKKLYEAYLTFDENILAESMADASSEDVEDYEIEYNNVVFHDRNVKWADKFAEYLAAGGTTFIFAGSGHFVGEDSVFSIMKENGTLR